MLNNLYYGYSKEIHELAEIYIQRDIKTSCTMLVNDLMDLHEGFTACNIHNYYEPPKMIIEAYYDPDNLLNGYELNSLSDVENLHDELWEIENPTSEQDSLMDCLKELIKQIEEPDMQEIFEWYEVTKWLAEKLIDLGDPILESDYGFYWGRTCTGQAIILDRTFQQIARNSLKTIGSKD